MKHLSAIVMTLTLAAPLTTLAGGPAKDSLVNKTKTRWRKSDDLVIGKIAKPQLVKMKATAESLHTFLQDSCFAGTGLDPVWHGEYLAEKTGDAQQVKYGIKCDFTTATGNATLGIIVNDLSPLTGHLTLDNKDVMTLPVSSGVHNECPYFETQGTNKKAIWVVTSSPDMLPYTPVTRKEYLNMVIGDLNTTKQQIIADVKSRTPVRSAEDQAAEKKRDLDELSSRYSGNELQLRTRKYLDQYKSDEDYQQKNIEKATADVDTTIAIVQGMLNHLAPATLASPAIVSPSSPEFQGFRDGEPGMVMLVHSNAAFFEPGAAQEKPQFFLITWNADAADASTSGLTSLISKDLDTRILKGMLKK